MSELRLSPATLARAITTGGGARIHSCSAQVVNDRLFIDLHSVDTQSVLGRIDATISVRATLENPNTVGIHVNLEKVLGGMVMLARPFMKQILESVIPPELKPFIRVESRDRLTIPLDQVIIKGLHLQALAEVRDFRLPADPNTALLLIFELK